jgi:hypothetical protein
LGFEVLTVVKMSMLFFWVVMLCGLIGRYQCYGETVSIFNPEDGDGMFLQNIGIYLQVHATSQPRTATLTNSLLIMRIVFISNMLSQVGFRSYLKLMLFG